MTSRKIIYHIFRADVHFMTVAMIEDIIVGSKFSHFFIIVGTDEKNKIYFLNLFKKYNVTNFALVNRYSSSIITRFIAYFFKKCFKLTFFKWEIDLLKFLSKMNRPHILIHAECSVLFSLFLSLKSKIKKN